MSEPDDIASLRADLERHRHFERQREIDGTMGVWPLGVWPEQLDRVLDEVERLRAENAELRAVQKSFAEIQRDAMCAMRDRIHGDLFDLRLRPSADLTTVDLAIARVMTARVDDADDSCKEADRE